MPLFKVEKQILSNLLKDRFLIPPFSIFDTKQGYWQDRKREWIKLGIQSEIGRKEKLTFHIDRTEKQYGNSQGKAQQTSIFDPVLCELSYKWFTRDRDIILDPFAGGSVRGIVAGSLGHQYIGIDLSEEQINANYQQYSDISLEYSGIVKPKWIVGNSENVCELVEKPVNFLFTCPPYYDLEVYSNDKNDLSNKSTYNDFLESYRFIINQSCSLLEDNSFAVFVVSDIRNNYNGGYYNLVGDTIKAFNDAGLIYYNEAIIVNVAGTLPIRTPGQFNQSRKFGKQHQNYLVFYKGNPKNINIKFGNFEKEKEINI